ncbi:MAG TPA: undecaprenyl-diphosphatase UppP [Bryobacteraceae bacterium]|nr:undecaprenyl-diphosphatase UppP [Bryobacteraceae bacterium]
MPLYQVIILAIVQGFTEFLPISSTAHLYLTSWLLGWNPQALEFDIGLHIGTLAAVLVYFFRDWVQIIAQGLGMSYGEDPQLRQNHGLFWLMVIGTIPVGVCGLLFHDYAETTWRNPYVMASMLIVVGVIMWIAESRSRRKRDLATVNVKDAATIGLAQALALVPGTSRSGITITAALFRGIDRESAARYSFLLSTPAIGAAALNAVYDLVKHGGMASDMVVPFAVGVLVSAATGWLVIAWFLRFLRHRTLRFFVYYRIVFGIIVLALALSR